MATLVDHAINATSTNPSTNVVAPTAPWALGAKTGDLLVWVVNFAAYEGTTALNISGWSRSVTISDGTASTSAQTVVYTRRATSNTEDAPSLTVGTATRYSTQLFVFTDVHQSIHPVNNPVAAAKADTSQYAVVPAFAPSSIHDILFVGCNMRGVNQPHSWTPPSGFVELYDHDQGWSDLSTAAPRVGIAYDTTPSSLSAVSRSFTGSQNFQNAVAWGFAIIHDPDWTQPVSRELSLSWRLRAAISKDLSALFRVRANVGKDASLRWHNLITAAKELDTQFNVLVRLFKDLETRYNILPPVLYVVGRSIEFRHAILTALNKSLGIEWHVRSRLNWDLSVPFNTLIRTGKSVDSRWNNRTTIGKSVQTLWQTAARVGSDLSLRFSNLKSIGKNVEFSWKLLTPMGRSLSISWRTIWEAIWTPPYRDPISVDNEAENPSAWMDSGVSSGEWTQIRGRGISQSESVLFDDDESQTTWTR